MGSMTWRPKDGDQKANEYLDTINHAPYFTIAIITTLIFCTFTLLVLMGAF